MNRCEIAFRGVRVLIEALGVIIEAFRMIIGAVRLFVEAIEEGRAASKSPH